MSFFFFFQAEDGIRDLTVTGVQTCALPISLHGQVVDSPDIRAGMAMLLAALAARGDSVIHNIGQIERGYERIDERLRALGARIERIDDGGAVMRSEEHTSELQSQSKLVFRLLL